MLWRAITTRWLVEAAPLSEEAAQKEEEEALEIEKMKWENFFLFEKLLFAVKFGVI